MDKALKQRLVGAIVLIALAVIVLPMIFGGRPSATGPETRSIELPAEPPDLDFETRRFPVGAEPGRNPDPGVGPGDADGEDTGGPYARPRLPEPDEPPPAVVQDVATGTSDDPGSKTDDAADSEARPEPAADAGMDDLVASLIATEESASSLRYIVQVASFGSSENAVSLAGRLEEAGYAVMLDHVSSETGRLNRVRVGPYASEQEAQEVVAQLRERVSGVNPRIVDMKPDEATPSLASEDPLMRWVVQVGSFSSVDNARDLVSRLRASGLSAFDETVRTDTSTIYRVRVGPYLDRAQALAAEQQIADDIGIDGVVMSSD